MLYQTWPTFAYTNLMMQKSIHSRKKIENLWKKFQNIMSIVHLSFLHAKHLLMELLFESLQTNADLLLVLIPANYTPSRCVNPCSTVLMRVWNSIQKPIDSHLDKTRSAAWKKIMSYFQRTSPKCEIERFFTTSRPKEIDCLSVDGFCSHCDTVLETMGCFYDFCPVKKYVLFSLKGLFNVVARRDSSMP